MKRIFELILTSKKWPMRDDIIYEETKVAIGARF